MDMNNKNLLNNKNFLTNINKFATLTLTYFNFLDIY
jgi:hypothetical protein